MFVDQSVSCATGIGEGRDEGLVDCFSNSFVDCLVNCTLNNGFELVDVEWCRWGGSVGLADGVNIIIIVVVVEAIPTGMNLPTKC